MHSSLYLLITIGVLAGFFMRPLNEFVLSKLISLEKYIDRKPLVILLLFTAILSSFFVTISCIYLTLMLSGFIPLGENAPAFIISFFIGGTLWVIYAKKTNRVCRV
ncbi:MAG: hypothetical protein OEY52_13265 [Gammaproteobacteria bacterium]|nr:hypothetical protein [Gammaproteobacteria bacterium]